MGCVTSYFPSLRELEISLEREEDFMGFFSDDDLELDEGTYLSTCADAYDDPIGGGQDLKRRSHFYYVHYHTGYMVSSLMLSGMLQSNHLDFRNF